jgi:phosphocarrier protein HPr
MDDASVTPSATGSVRIEHEIGLHARPSVKLTQLAKTFDSRIEFAASPEGPWVDAKSIVKVMGSKTPKGAMLHFRANGQDATAAVQALIALVERDFELTS